VAACLARLALPLLSVPLSATERPPGPGPGPPSSRLQLCSKSGKLWGRESGPPSLGSLGQHWALTAVLLRPCVPTAQNPVQPTALAVVALPVPTAQCPLIMMIGRRLIRGCSCGLHCRCTAAAAAALSALPGQPGCSTQGQSQALSLVTPSRLRDGVSTRGRAQPCCFWGISRCLDMQGRADSGDSGSGPAAARAGDAGPTPGTGPQALRASGQAQVRRLRPVPGGFWAPGPRARSGF
jgi:hypothetical protein